MKDMIMQSVRSDAVPAMIRACTEWLKPDGTIEKVIQPVVVVREATRAEYEAADSA